MHLPLRIELRASRQLAIYLLSLHLLALGCVLSLPWTGLVKSVLMLSLLLPLGIAWWQAPPVEALRLGSQGELHCFLANGESVAAILVAESAVFEFLVVLRLRLGTSRRVSCLTLCRDSMSAGQFRRLRVWLRWRASLKDDVLERV